MDNCRINILYQMDTCNSSRGSEMEQMEHFSEHAVTQAAFTPKPTLRQKNAAFPFHFQRNPLVGADRANPATALKSVDPILPL